MSTIHAPATAIGTTHRVSTRALLTCAAVAAPLWAVVSLTQAATRAGFDLTRHPLSALSNGDLGWLQITNFLVCGILTVAGAIGLRRVVGSPWAARLVAVNGVGMFAAGLLVMDPPEGFGAGQGASMTMSWHMIGHMLAGTVAFIALAAACFVLTRHFGRSGQRAAAAVSSVAGLAVVFGDGWATTGAPMGSLTIAVGVIPAMLWIAVLAASYRRSA